ncbi:hypothetical protein MSPP1_000211 [Malassezia sp. CBS 17886]|nr:hypothetical protein MSPP1_000211 [Malassezia sp. CBS 17886]
MSRETSTLLLVHDADQVYAGVGIYEPFRRPTVTLTARAGRKRSSNTWLVGAALDDAVASAPDDVHVVYPLQDGDVRDWDAMVALWSYVLVECLEVRVASNAYFVMLALPSPLSRDAYERSAQIFFEMFNVPALCIGEVPLMDTYAVGLLNAMVVTVGWEETSVVAIGECAVLPGAGVLSKIGLTHCTWWLAFLLAQDAETGAALRTLAPHDTDAAALELAHQLVEEGHVYVDANAAGNAIVTDQENGDEDTFDVAAALVEGRERDVVEERQRQKGESAAQESDVSDVVRVHFRGAQVSVGRVRGRFHEPLLHPQLLERVQLSVRAPAAVVQALRAQRIGGEPACLALPDAALLVVNNVQPPERRPVLWDSLVLPGPATCIRGLTAEFLRAFATLVTTEQTEAGQLVGEPNPVQPHSVRAHKFPDYFAEFKERMDLAAYLGATIYAKLVFGDLSGRNYITKLQYNEGGPAMAYALGSG